MREVPFITPAERRIYVEYDRDRRLRLSRIIAPVFASILGVVLLAALFVPAQLTGTRAHYGLVLLCWACFSVGTVAAWRKRVNLATGSILLAALFLMALAVVVNQPFIMSDLFTVPAVVVIGLSALIGLPWMILATTACTCLFVVVLSHSPSLRLDLADPNNMNSLGAFIIEQVILATIVYAAARGYQRTLRHVGDVRVQYERAKRLDELKDQFITNVNHELRNPVMLMQGYIELLRSKGEELPPERRRGLVERASQAGDHLVELLRSILDVRRLDQGVREYVPEGVPLLPAVTTAATLVDPRETEPVERALRVQVPVDLVVWGERIRLQQILLNLLSNAVKYSAPGTPIEVSARVVTELPQRARLVRSSGYGRRGDQSGSGARGGGMVEIAVRDHGLGIPPEQIPLLFQRFVRLPRDLASTVVGNGLGLYLCRELAEAMGGRIWVESSGIAGEGSTFSVRLPLAPGTETGPAMTSASPESNATTQGVTRRRER
jgi:signal transduction histidine kinase